MATSDTAGSRAYGGVRLLICGLLAPKEMLRCCAKYLHDPAQMVDKWLEDGSGCGRASYLTVGDARNSRVSIVALYLNC